MDASVQIYGTSGQFQMIFGKWRGLYSYSFEIKANLSDDLIS